MSASCLYKHFEGQDDVLPEFDVVLILLLFFANTMREHPYARDIVVSSQAGEVEGNNVYAKFISDENIIALFSNNNGRVDDGTG